MPEFNNISKLTAWRESHDWIEAESFNGSSIWITQKDGSEVSIYSRDQAIALRDWLTRAIGDELELKA